MFNRDRMVNASAGAVAHAAMSVLDAVQTRPPEAQVLGAAAFFITACERFGVPAQDAFTAVTNLMNDREGRKPEFAAVRLYMENEL